MGVCLLYKVTERQTSIEIIGKHEMNLPVYMARGHLFTSQVKIRYQSAIGHYWFVYLTDLRLVWTNTAHMMTTGW